LEVSAPPVRYLDLDDLLRVERNENEERSAFLWEERVGIAKALREHEK
jgi:hypothetical protein